MPTNDTPFIPQAPSGPATAPGIRNYDYTYKYPRDKRGEEHKENARVWNVYLDEAEMYDTEMIQGYRNVIDGLLVFAALFSAIVTTFVAQTSQALQPDNTQIMVSLLVETNLLLRAAGNVTTLNNVPRSLPPGATTHTTIDVWVNGLFFSSLSLSLSSALLTVLAKQWIQKILVWVGLPLSRPLNNIEFRMDPGSLRQREHYEIMEPYRPLRSSCTIFDSLVWLANQSTNQSVVVIIAEAASGLLLEKDMNELPPDGYFGPDAIRKAPSRSFHCFRYSQLLFTSISSLEQKISVTDAGHDPYVIAIWEHLIQTMFEASSDGYRIEMHPYTHFFTADHLNDTALCERILNWSRIFSESDEELEMASWNISYSCGAAGARALLHKFPHILYNSVIFGTTFFHQAAGLGNTKIVAAILEDHPSIISFRDLDDKTALEHAASDYQLGMVDFLLEQGSGRPPHLVHELIRKRKFIPALHLLERGWSPFLKDKSGETALEIANRMYHVGRGTHYPDDKDEDVRDLLDKMKLMERELLKSEATDNATVTLTTS
ncbi:hypothetical protein DXG01_009267 [Tephrocybe rancida]|nr:hypothetical protein DXG01_009267 [Tephrocybe rancida]